MKPGVRLLVVPALAALSAGPAPAATRSYLVTDFDSIRLEAPIAVSVQRRPGISARAEGDPALLDRIDLAVSGHILTIRLKAPTFEGRKPGPAASARVILTAPALRKLQLEGAGTLSADGLAAPRAELVVAGSGTLIVGGIAADTLDVAQVGAGSLRLAGKAATTTMHLSGTGTVDAAALAIADLSLTADGNADARAQASRAARIIATGPANVVVEGKAACTVRHIGSGTVRCAGQDY